MSSTFLRYLGLSLWQSCDCHAARGGQPGKVNNYLYSGSNDPDEVAWYDSNAKAGNTNGSLKTTRPVGTKKPNELGLYDMSGNVWEWCSDRYGEDYYKISPQQNPRGSNRGAFRVYRGGGWSISSQGCRAVIRSFYGPTYRVFNIGFRLARP